jgi:hypothetical protein
MKYYAYILNLNGILPSIRRLCRGSKCSIATVSSPNLNCGKYRTAGKESRDESTCWIPMSVAERMMKWAESLRWPWRYVFGERKRWLQMD